MWKVQLPDNSSALNELAVALTYANGNAKYVLSKEEKLLIINIYREYERVEGIANDTLKGLSLSEITREAIYNAYNEIQIDKRLNYLRDRLLLNAGYCPCCGISVADELDHHLPRSRFSPLAVYSSNLVPICHKCNNKKRTITGENPYERFIHVYYENLPETEQFLHVGIEIGINSIDINFFIEKITSINNLQHTQLSFQMQRVNLNDRLQREINVFLLSFVGGLQLSYENGVEKVKQFLLKSAEALQKKIGINHWRTVLLFALADNEAFCDGGFITALGL